METQNEQLEKILKLIQENFEAKTIDKNDLNEIIFFTSGILKVESMEFVFTNKTLNHQWNLDPGVITDEEAKVGKAKYSETFSSYGKLTAKIFKFKSKIISDFLQNESELKVYFAQNKNGHLCILIKNGTANYMIDETSFYKIDDQIKQDCIADFNADLKGIIQANLTKGYTEYVTIPFATNFDQFKGVFPNSIVLIPALGNDKHEGRVTFVMHFEDANGNRIYDGKKYSNSDTFSPHP